MRNRIFGYGEVGKAIECLITGEIVGIHDKEKIKPVLQTCDILHICIPYSDDFVDAVNEVITILMPTYLIIHSTVMEGTTKKIMHTRKLYSPIIGSHNQTGGLVSSMKHFDKFFSGKREDFDVVHSEFNLAAVYWNENHDSLEFAKAMCTSYMYWCLVFEKVISAECEGKGYDRELVYKKWNEAYNEGYQENLMRPIYAHVSKILPGGHCLRANIHLINNFVTETLREWESINASKDDR